MAPDLPSPGSAGGGTHLRRLPCLLPARDPEEPTPDSRARTLAQCGVGKVGHHPNDRRLDSDARPTLAHSSALHSAVKRAPNLNGQAPPGASCPASTSNQNPHTQACRTTNCTRFVVKTFR